MMFSVSEEKIKRPLITLISEVVLPEVIDIENFLKADTVNYWLNQTMAD